MQRIANTSNITFHGIESEALLILLDMEGNRPDNPLRQ